MKRTFFTLSICIAAALPAATQEEELSPLEELGRALLLEALKEAGVDLPEDGPGEDVLSVSDTAMPLDVVEGFKGPVMARKLETEAARVAADEAHERLLEQANDEASRHLRRKPDGTCPEAYVGVLSLGTEHKRVSNLNRQGYIEADLGPVSEAHLAPTLRVRMLEALQNKPTAVATSVKLAPEMAKSYVPPAHLKALRADAITTPQALKLAPAGDKSLPTQRLTQYRAVTLDADAVSAMRLESEQTPARVETDRSRTEDIVAADPQRLGQMVRTQPAQSPTVAIDPGLSVFSSAEPDWCPPPQLVGEQTFFQVVHAPELWMQEGSVTVAFNGGSLAMRRAIKGLAEDWVKDAALTFEFGQDTASGFEFYEWSTEDTAYAADIRISFAQQLGYWSVIGNQAAQPEVVGPGEASMNLAGFDGYSQLPSDWRRFVYHEFGHALGLAHEHQHPESACGAALRIEDEPGYVQTIADGRFLADGEGRQPGLVRILQTAPNNWPADYVRYNLDQFRQEPDHVVIEYDNASIMKYAFPLSWYKTGTPDGCLPNQDPPEKPSPADYQAVIDSYAMRDVFFPPE
ncbi:MAG: hypothetical protein AAFQ21_09110 [Pseudomonadota bacterium]